MGEQYAYSITTTGKAKSNIEIKYYSYKLYLIQLPLHLRSLSPEFFDKFQLRLDEFDLRSIVIHKFINRSRYDHLLMSWLRFCGNTSVIILLKFGVSGPWPLKILEDLPLIDESA